MSGLRSGQVAARAGVHPQTLRYYERRGLIPAPDRTPGGHRSYPPGTVTVLRSIKAAQALGFTLDEVAGLLDSGLRARALGKLAQVEARIAGLQTVAESLRAAVEAGCDDLVACAAEPRCPIPLP